MSLIDEGGGASSSSVPFGHFVTSGPSTTYTITVPPGDSRREFDGSLIPAEWNVTCCEDEILYRCEKDGTEFLIKRECLRHIKANFQEDFDSDSNDSLEII